MMDATFGGGVFGGAVFASLVDFGSPPPSGARGVGGSGFEADWRARLLGMIPNDFEMQEIEDMIAAGLI